MGNDDDSSTNGSVQYYTSTKEDFDIVPVITVLGILGAIAGAAYIVNNNILRNSFMGEGRILNNYFHRIDPLEDLSEKSPYIQRQYRTHNIVYPDIMYEGVQKQPDQKILNDYVDLPIPPSGAERAQLTYAEPSNIVTDKILYEQGTPDIREDYRITGEIPNVAGAVARRRGFGRRDVGGIDFGASNTIFTTEYAPGINEKTRRDNPVVISEPIKTPSGRVVRKISRLKPVDIPSRRGRRFNKDYDEYGKPLVQHDPVYDTVDALSDLKLTNEDFGEGEAGGRITDESLKVFEDFVMKGKLRQGYEIIPSED
jgi:hypothetical protein